MKTFFSFRRVPLALSVVMLVVLQSCIYINTRDNDPATAQAFVRAFGVEYPNLYDPDGALLLGFGQVPPKAIPSTLVIDASGRVAARMLGEVTTATLVGVVEDVVAAG